MSERNYPSVTGCIQKYLGTAYDNVKKVADNLETITNLSELTQITEVLAEITAITGGVEDSLAAVNASLAGKQNLLESSTNIKTINGVSILGSGNINVLVSSEVSVVDLLSTQDYLEQLILMGV